MNIQLKPLALATLIANISLPSMAFSATTSYQAVMDAWQNGQLGHGLMVSQQPESTAIDTDTRMLQGEAFEAEGNNEQAQHIFAQLLAKGNLSDEQQQFLQIKLALLQDEPGSFTQLASSHPQLTEQLAKVVSIQQNIAEAINLLAPLKEHTASTQLTLAGWLLDSDQLDAAQNAAWSAFNLAQDSDNKHYALALFAEAVRQNHSTPQVLETLSTYTDDAFLTPLYIDLLLETGQLDKALALTEKSTLPDIKSRRVALLSLSDNQQGLSAYYRQLILTNPAELSGYFGLAGVLVSRGDIQSARQVFQQLSSNNPNNKTLLLNAAKRMIAMNMQDDAIHMLSTLINNAKTDPQVNNFLFSAYLNNGEDIAAGNILNQMAHSAAPNSPTQLLVVSGFERLNLSEKALETLQSYQQNGGVLSYDQQLHLADLAKSAGKDDIALAQWETLWQQATLPARKHFLEGLLVKALLKNGSLETRLAQLEKSLSAGKIAQHELNLLVALYLANNNLADAETAINHYAQQLVLPDKQRLEMLASLFGRGRAYNKLNEVWRHLAVIDVDNAQQYWQQITLNSLRNNAFERSDERSGVTPQEQRLTQVNRLIDKLSSSDESADPAFIASIYSMAGLPDEAIAQYRLALHNHPGPDVLLQLVELYKKQGLFQEAVRLLQGCLLRATTNVELMTAIDAGCVKTIDHLLD